MNDQLPSPIAHDSSQASALAIPTQDDVLAARLQGLTLRTRNAYEKDLRDFSRFVKVATPSAAVDLLLASGSGAANSIALGYRAHLTERGLAPATISQRVSVLRSIVCVARMIGRITWTLDVKQPRTGHYRDTRGPRLEKWRRLVFTIQSRALEGESTAIRDLAMVRLLHDLRLRRAELVAVDLADLELEESLADRQVKVIGKGKTEKTGLNLNSECALAIANWVLCRGREPGPLFVRLDRATEEPIRLTGEGVRRIVRRWARLARLGRYVRPHGLLH